QREVILWKWQGGQKDEVRAKRDLYYNLRTGQVAVQRWPFRVLQGEDDLKELQGVWVLAAEVEGGRKLRPRPLRAVVAGDSLTFEQGGQVLGRWQIQLGPGKSPRSLVMCIRLSRVFGVPCAGWREGEDWWVVRASYALDGDTLRLCYDMADNS